MKSAKKLNHFNQKIKLEQFNDHFPLINVQKKKNKGHKDRNVLCYE